ncbi:hypothetical protein GF402_07750 [Candidatus Fermentibacteria bacterium]|nr:hypothetical protein [Candidatus Fermentibacteria bacterium]
MLAILPQRWARDDLDADLEWCLRGREPALDRVRRALGEGERTFLIGAEGAAFESCFLLARDHLSLFGDSPLVGPNADCLGPRFPSLDRLYLVPEGSWKIGVVCRVPDWRLGTPAELMATRSDALVSDGVDEAIVAGHGGGRVAMMVRCHGWGHTNEDRPPLGEVLGALGRSMNNPR